MDSYIQGVRIHKFKRIILTARKVQLAQHWARSLGMNKAWPRSCGWQARTTISLQSSAQQTPISEALQIQHHTVTDMVL